MTDHDDTKGRAVTRAVVQGLVAAGGAAGATLHPELAIPLAGLVASAGSVVTNLLAQVNPFRRHQMVKAVAAGSAHEGLNPEDLELKAAETEFKQMVTAEMLEAAARSAYEAKIVALGWAWAHGVAADDEAVLAVEQQFIRAVSRLEVAHIRVLDVVGQTPNTLDRERHARLDLVDGWTVKAVTTERPEYGAMVEQLLAVLSSEGLITTTRDNMTVKGSQYLITKAGLDVLSRLAKAEASLSVPSLDHADDGRASDAATVQG